MRYESFCGKAQLMDHGEKGGGRGESEMFEKNDLKQLCFMFPPFFDASSTTGGCKPTVGVSESIQNK